ncbi:DUF7824 domain-containing protein [Actinoplanes utahensis]|uniref:DUF7824 domain-containing protein n=1 Tax=Actinoplanes utahensis TaxID=1869 RepID=UPI0019523746|nr:DUF6493 family protein [Actinoplanes utahensis]GIF34430.1 hypothetical protein Aut01nite_74160 [Actinoplanes utahensis]
MLIDEAVFDRYMRDSDGAALTAGLLAMDERARVALCTDLGARIKQGVRWWRDRYVATEFYGLAVIACAPSAARAATMLLHREMRDWDEIPVGHFLEIARARGLSWVGDLGVRLARRIPAGGVLGSGDWRFVAALLAEGKTDPPVTEGVVRSWLTAVHSHPAGPLTDRLRGEPFLDLLLPPVFEIDGLGTEFGQGAWTDGGWDPAPRFPGAVAELVAEGRLDRERILGATVDRLARGDRPVHLRPFVMLHAALRPTVTELAAHTPGYARMLSEAPSTVATLAQQSLRAVDEAGLLELVTLLEASGPALARREKTVVKAQLTWLDRVARRTPERAGEILVPVTEALHHPAIEIQERALTVISRHLPHVAAGSAEHARIAAAAVAMPGAQGARAAAMFGVAPAAGPPVVAALAPAPPAAPMPPPIRSPGELAEEVSTLVHDETAVRWERVLDGLVTLARSGLGETLGPVLDRYPGRFHNSWGRMAFLGAAIRAAAGQEPDLVMSERLRAATHGPLSAHLHTPTAVLSLRVAEIAAGLAETPTPALLATPTHVTGSLDAHVLVDRLAGLETTGRPPLPLDFQQALLRVRRTTDPATLARAEALTSPAGRQLAAWLRSGGLPDPVSTRFEQCTRDRDGNVVVRRVVANLESARTDDDRIVLEDALVSLTRRSRPDYQASYAEVPDVLAMMVPHHREIAAAWALPGIAALADQDDSDASLLPLLAEAAGPIGPAMTTALAYGFGARHQNDRAAAVDAFLLLAATAWPPAPTPEKPATGDQPAATGQSADTRQPATTGQSADTRQPATTGLSAATTEPAAAKRSRSAAHEPFSPAPEPQVTGDTAQGFASGVGAELGDLCSDGTVKLSRVVPALNDAFEAGAAVAVWETLRAALPPLLQSSPPNLPAAAPNLPTASPSRPASARVLPASPRNLPDLLELATRVASATGTRDDIPGLAAVVARGGGSRLVREAKRLHTTLAPG